MDAVTGSLWQEAEQHVRESERLARRTVKEAWLAILSESVGEQPEEFEDVKLVADDGR